MRIRVLTAVALSVVTTAMSGCSGFWTDPPSNGGAKKPVLYVINRNGGNSGGVVPFSIGSSGLLAKLSPEVAAGRGPSSVAITPRNTYLYVGNTGGGISAFRIASDGTLSQLNGSPFGTGITPSSLAVDSTGAFLYALNTASWGISVYQIAAGTGALSLLQTVYFSSIASVSGPLYAVRAAPNRRCLYVALGVDGIWVFKIGADGALTFASSTAAPISGQSVDVSFDPQGAYAYVPDGVRTVWVYWLEQSGGLSQLAASVLAVNTWPVTTAVDKSGKYLYTANQGAYSVSALVRNNDGTLTALPGEPATGQLPTSISIDSSGKFVYVTNRNGAPDVSIYQIQADGTLNSVGSASSGTEPIRSVATN